MQEPARPVTISLEGALKTLIIVAQGGDRGAPGGGLGGRPSRGGGRAGQQGLPFLYKALGPGGELPVGGFPPQLVDVFPQPRRL